MQEKTDPLIDCSLLSLRVFREAAKCGNFTAAAVRMAITQSAVSHHVRLLERQLHVKLFERRGRTLALTDEGRALHQTAEEAFTRLAATLEQIRAGDVRQRVVLGVLASFATKWLVPRLGDFYQAHPDIELVVRSVNHTINVELENVDLAVITAPAAPASAAVSSHAMWSERLFAVCSPQYAAATGLKSLRHLARHTLLHDETEIAAERGFDWRSWLQHFGIESLVQEASSQYFSQSDLTLQAAIAGHGIALARTSIAATDIKNGLLVNPFPKSEIATHSSCYLCGEKSSWDKDGCRQLREWLCAEVAADDSIYRAKGAH